MARDELGGLLVVPGGVPVAVVPVGTAAAASEGGVGEGGVVRQKLGRERADLGFFYAVVRH